MKKLCTIADCKKKHFGKGMCAKHYMRWYTHGDPLAYNHKLTGGNQSHLLYATYNNMLQRCYSPKSSSYSNYGARGITVCDRWRGTGGFTNFISDMGDKPLNHSLDRIDNNGNYTPENCKWSSRREQNCNTRKTTAHPGVRWLSKINKYQARIVNGRKEKTLGYFERLEDAIKARKNAEQLYAIK